MKKIIFFCGDGFIALVGIIFIGYGIYLQKEHGNALQVMSLGVSYPIKLLFTIGILLIIISAIVGFAGYVSDVIWMQVSIGCLFLVLLIQLITGGMALTHRIDVQRKSNKMYENMKSRFFDLKENGVQWGTMETKNHCCGLDSSSDYGLFGKFTLNGILNAINTALSFIPFIGSWLGSMLNSAADRVDEIINFQYPSTCLKDPDDRHSGAWTQGCFQVAKKAINRAVLVVGIISLASSIAVGLMIALAFQLVSDLVAPKPEEEAGEPVDTEETEEKEEGEEDEEGE